MATFQDGDGVLESVNSAATAAVVNVNNAPTGVPALDDTTPSEGAQILATTTQIADLDGLTGVVFAHQWQVGDGTTWANVAGATSATFTPATAQVGQRLRVVVSFTDNNGTQEQVMSSATDVVTAIPPVAPVAPASGGGVSANRLASGFTLTGAVVPRLVPASAVASQGVTVKFTAPTETSVVRVRVMRPGSPRVLAKAIDPVARRRRDDHPSPPVDREGPSPRRDLPDRDDSRHRPQPVGCANDQEDHGSAVAQPILRAEERGGPLRRATTRLGQ